MKHHISALGSTCVLTLDGELDALACEELTPVLEQMPGECQEVLVDLTAVPFVDSSGIGALIFLAQNMFYPIDMLHL